MFELFNVQVVENTVWILVSSMHLPPVYLCLAVNIYLPSVGIVFKMRVLYFGVNDYFINYLNYVELYEAEIIYLFTCT